MANDFNLQEQLRQGVEAARKGDKVTARRLLSQVLLSDRNNETALMWMASVVETVGERRQYLERVLKLNPNNQRAAEALSRLGGTPPAPRPAAAPGTTDSNTPRRATQQDVRDYVPRLRDDRTARGPGVNPFILSAFIVAGVIIVIVVAALSTPPQVSSQDTFAQTFTAVAQTMEMATRLAPAVAAGPTATLPPGVTPTATEFFGVLVTLDPNARTLPPTFTPTPTETPTETPTPTPTPLPLSGFRLLYTEYAADAAAPDAYLMQADGSGAQRIPGGENVLAAAPAPNGGSFAFVRGGSFASSVPPTPTPTPTPVPVATVEGSTVSEVGSAGGSTADAAATEVPPGEAAPVPLLPENSPQLYIAALGGDATPRALTTLTGSRIGQPAWSPDGGRLVFASNQDGDLDLFFINADGTGLQQITSNIAVDTDPAWSPDGTRIAFASDVESPGFTEIYLLDVAGGAITRLTDRGGSSFAPAWSPDGTRIAYLNDGGGDSDVYVMDADGQRDFLVTFDDNGGEDRSPTWTPDGRLIAFASNRTAGTRFQPYLADLDGAVTPLTTTDGSIETLAFFR